MPGISLCYNFGHAGSSGGHQSILEGSCLHDDFTVQTLYHKENVFIAFSGYKEYPVEEYHNDNFSIFLEGKIYNLENKNIKVELFQLANMMMNKSSSFKKALRSWVWNQDGEFICILYNKNSGEIVIFNDMLGLLPLYYSIEKDTILVSREMRFMSESSQSMSFDRIGIAQYLLFGFALGKRTLLDNVNRLPAASIMTFNTQKNDKCSVESEEVYNFDLQEHKGKNISENAENLHDVFVAACSRRADQTGKNIISLSGGLDSRAVAAGLKKSHVPFSGATFIDYQKTAIQDGYIAEQLSAAFEINWELFQLDQVKGSHLSELLQVKSGINGLEMAFIVQFFKKILQKHGRELVHFTGAGGGRLKPDSKPANRIQSLEETVHYTLKKYQRLSLSRVASLVRLDKQDILQEITELFSAYPEQKMNGKMLHFKVYERAFKCFFEAEDRDRSYLWSTTPFYGVDFFRYTMNCPEKQKEGYKLYIEFLKRLSSNALDINNVDWNIPVSSPVVPLYLWAHNLYLRMPSNIKTSLKKVLSRKKKQQGAVSDEYMRCILKQIQQCETINKYLAVDKMRDLSAKEFYPFFTLTSLIEQHTEKEIVLAQYSDQPFPESGSVPLLRSILDTLQRSSTSKTI
ncbi:MAG: hypothetical protein D3905_06840 [Candidatus Electrothrix sp. AS4_5]|nr:hypothetical protein [Candidatus Electrothrix gigas]